MSTDRSTSPRTERVLAYSTLSVVTVSVAAYLTTLIASALNREAPAAGFLHFVTWIAYVGLPIGFVLLVALIWVNLSRRSRANRASARPDPIRHPESQPDYTEY